MKDKLYRYAGLTLEELAATAGRTPAYFYSRTLFDQKISETRQLLPDDIALHYSIKANPHPQTVSAIASKVDGLDVSSHAEMLLAIGAGISHMDISFSGPGKNNSELRAAILAGIVLHVESLSELDRIMEISAQTGKTANLVLRINPDFTARQSGMVMGGGSQPFGIDAEHIGSAIDKLHKSGQQCQGFHCYAGSQMLNAELVARLQAQTLAMMHKLVSDHQLDNVSLNIGGGFGVPYFPNETPLNLQFVGEQLDKQLELIRRVTRINKVIVELGRYIVAESGIYLARIIEKKVSRATTYVVLEGGMNHHLAASGNLGQVIRRNYPVECSFVKGSAAEESITLVGPLCTPLDVLGSDVLLPVLEAGDLVAVMNSGAYGFSASPHRFLSHPPPVEVLI